MIFLGYISLILILKLNWCVACQTTVDCSNHGNCLNGDCQCDHSWTGTQCQLPNCVFGQTDKQGKCKCDYSSTLENGICTKQCKHGIFNNSTGKCICNKNWSTAGITDTIDWLKGNCNQFHCQDNNQCQSLLPSVNKPTCPVKGWNCYCGFSKMGYQDNKAGCMSFPYVFSVSVFKVYEYLCLSLFWKIGIIFAILSLPFGRRRPNCDHHRSWMAYIKRYFGYPTNCDGSCVYQKRWCVRDDLALTLYAIKTTVWWYIFSSSLILVLGYVWSMIVWVIISVILMVAACVACLAAINGDNNGCDGGDSCNSDCCFGCNGEGCCSNGNQVNSNTYHTSIIYIGGPYPDTYFCCYPCETSSYYGNTNRERRTRTPRMTYPSGNTMNRSSTTSNNSSGSSNCCCWCLNPIKYLLNIYPVFPENLHGGFVGYLMGTHIKRNNYTGGNKYIEWMGLSQFRTSDLRHNQDWRNTIHYHLRDGQSIDRSYTNEFGQITDNDYINTNTNTNINTNYNKLPVTTSTPILDNDYYTVNKYGIHLNYHQKNISDGCKVVNDIHVETNECWICSERVTKWHVWKSCRHAYCETCSEEMLNRKMPCPLCRTVPISIDVYQND